MEYRMYIDGGEFNSEGFLAELLPKQRKVLQALWKLGKGCVDEVLEACDEAYTYRYVSETLISLTSKNYLCRCVSRTGGILYVPKFDEKAVKIDLLKKTAHAYFNDSFKEIVAFMVEEKKVTAVDLWEISEILLRLDREAILAKEM